MPKRRVKKTSKQAPSSPVKDDDSKETQNQAKDVSLLDHEVERQIAAIRATQDVEIEHLLTVIRLLRSYLSEEDLKTPARQFFEKNLPDLLIVRNEETGEFEVCWKDKGDSIYMDGDGIDLHTSILRQMSVAYPDYSTIRSMGGFELSTETVKTRILGADNLNIRDFNLEGPSDSQMLAMQDGLQTPGVSSQRLSIGMMPKTTLRHPKPGEMLLSVHGSPLGVYKKKDMEAIHESKED